MNNYNHDNDAITDGAWFENQCAAAIKFGTEADRQWFLKVIFENYVLPLSKQMNLGKSEITFSDGSVFTPASIKLQEWKELESKQRKPKRPGIQKAIKVKHPKVASKKAQWESIMKDNQVSL